MPDNWIQACSADTIGKEDVTRFDHGDRTFAIYRTADDKFYATDGHCTHAEVHLADGFVFGNLIECPKHNGQFNFCTGQAVRLPVRVPLHTYPVKVDNGHVFINLAEP